MARLTKAEIMSMGLRDLKKLSTQELESAQRTLMRTRASRVRQFKKKGHPKGIPSNIKRMKSNKTRGGMIKNINELSNWMFRSNSTWRGYKKELRERRKALEDVLGRKFKNYAEFEEFGNFMRDMQNRAGGMWDVQSMSGAELFVQAKRLNLKPKQLVENYDYWLSHLKQLQSIDSRKKLDDKVKGEDYTKMLNLPSIENFYDDLEKKRERARRNR